MSNKHFDRLKPSNEAIIFWNIFAVATLLKRISGDTWQYTTRKPNYFLDYKPFNTLDFNLVYDLKAKNL